MATAVSDLFITLRAETAPFTRGMRTAAEEGESFTSRMGGMRAAMVKLGAATTLVGVGFVAYGVKAAGDFQQSMNLLVTACGESAGNLKKVSDGVMSLARSTGTSTEQLADGMYQVEKAGYRGADGLKVLRAAAQGAREEGADLKTVTSAMTSVMASYHLKAADSVRVMNAIKTAAGEGKVTMQEFSSSLSTVLPIASANKISFGEVAGAIATLSQHGTSAREATQELASTIKNLASAQGPAITEMQRLGLSSVDVSTHLGQRGLTGTLDMLSRAVLSKMGPSGTLLLSTFNKTKQAAADADAMVKSMPASLQKLATGYAKGTISLGDWRQTLKTLPPAQANLLSQYATLQNKTNGFSAELKKGGPSAQTYTEAIKRLTGGAIGLNTTLQLTGENTEGFKDRVAKVSASMNNASKDVEGWKITQASFNVQMGRLKEAITTAAITIGLKLIPVILKAVNFFEQHRKAALALAAVIGTVLVAAVTSFAAGAVVGAVKGLIDIGKGLKAATLAVRAFATSEKVAAVASRLWAAAQWALNAAQDANPMVLLVIAIAALVAGLVYAYFHCEKFRQIVQAAFEGIKVAAVAVWHAVQAAWNGLVVGVTWLWHAMVSAWNAVASVTSTVWNGISGFFRKWWPLLLVIFLPAIAILVAVWNRCHTQILGAVTTVWNAIRGFLSAIWGGIKTAAGILWGAIESSVIRPMMSVWHGLQSLWRTVSGWLSAAWKGIRGVASSVWASIRDAMTGPISSAWRTITTTVGKIKTAIKSGLDKAYDAVAHIGDKFLGIGTAIVKGIVQGVKDKARDLAGAAKDVAKGALDSAKSFLHVNSPSKVFADQVGSPMSEGIAVGIGNSAHLAHRAITDVAKGTVTAFASELEINSPSRKFKALGAWAMHGLVDGLTGSTASVKAATSRLARDLYVDFGTHHKGLQKAVARDNAQLMSLAKHRDSVAAKLKAAQKKLSDLQKAWASEKASVASSVMQSASIVTTSPDEGRAVNSFDVVAQMRDKVQQAVQFAANLAQLRKKGLGSDLIEQLANSGVDQGGATAQALAAASSGQIQEMNKLQAGLKTAANSTGTAVADSMYSAGIKSAQGLVKGLQSQEAAIERQMRRIALAMQKAIKKALGIHSPSRVFAALGQFIPQGLAQGIQDGAHHATAAVSGLAGAAVGGLGGAALAGAGGATVVNNYLNVQVAGSVMSDQKLVDVVERGFLKLGARNPQTYQPYKR
ncbi:phage tail tape measure protein [Streptomyces sp. NPDC008139]|uniref:phage tail tape measure protein n=1 Tax=Streptomyces sp. NPDC008139 TaxID=3364814 RepID=UPI0036E55AFE